MRGVQTLFDGIHIEKGNKRVGHGFKDRIPKIVQDNGVANTIECLFAHISGIVADILNIQRIMPLLIKRQLRQGLAIGNIEGLLQNKNT